MPRTKLFALALLLAGLLVGAAAGGTRVKDITDVEGARPNQLTGLGLVVGLNNTGGKSSFTQQVAVDLLQRFCITAKIIQIIQTDNAYKAGNVSVVMVTAEIGPFTRKGSRIDVTVSAFDDARSLYGGTLILTPLRGADGEIYAVAQGELAVGGFSFRGQAAGVQKNHSTVGRIAGGALIEREARGEVLCNGRVRLLLRNADYSTATSIARAVNAWLPGHALPLDGGTVQVEVPPPYWPHTVAFLSDLGNLEVIPDAPARVVINERTGTIVAGERVTISTVAIAHGNLAVVARETPVVSQPNPFGRGKTVTVPRTELGVTEQGGLLHLAPRSVTVADLARALNALGVTPRDLISIFQALKRAGALQAELVVM
jgi:flagellar P-ring protein precursor FlgI